MQFLSDSETDTHCLIVYRTNPNPGEMPKLRGGSFGSIEMGPMGPTDSALRPNSTGQGRHTRAQTAAARTSIIHSHSRKGHEASNIMMRGSRTLVVSFRGTGSRRNIATNMHKCGSLGPVHFAGDEISGNSNGLQHSVFLSILLLNQRMNHSWITHGMISPRSC